MATKITRWQPDSCSCIVEYSWDDETSETDRVHTPTTIMACEQHIIGFGGPQNLAEQYDAVVATNREANLAKENG